MVGAPVVEGSTERRLDPRTTFPFQLRPVLRTRFARLEVINASNSGLLLVHTIPAKPRVGDRLDGVLEWPHDYSPIEFRGVVARVGAGDLAVTFHRGLIPFAYFR